MFSLAISTIALSETLHEDETPCSYARYRWCMVPCNDLVEKCGQLGASRAWRKAASRGGWVGG